MSKKILYIDMDGVIADFGKTINQIDPTIDMSNSEVNYLERSRRVDEICEKYTTIFEYLEPIKDAIESVKQLFDKYEVYFLSTPMWNVPDSYKGKRIWLSKYFGELATKKLILTHRKDLALGDILVDDRIKNGVENFKGEHIHFGNDKFPNWKSVLEYLILKYSGE